MATRLPHQAVISSLAWFAHSTMFVVEWLEHLAPHSLLVHISGVLARGHATALDISTGPFLFYVCPRLIRFVAWTLRLMADGLDRIIQGFEQLGTAIDSLSNKGRRWLADRCIATAAKLAASADDTSTGVSQPSEKSIV